MGRKQVHLMIDEYVWTQFQALYPRQATATFEEALETMINLKLDISDQEGETLREEREILKRKADAILSELREREAKLNAWEAQKREALLINKKKQKEEDDVANAQIDALIASGALAKSLD